MQPATPLAAKRACSVIVVYRNCLAHRRTILFVLFQLVYAVSLQHEGTLAGEQNPLILSIDAVAHSSTLT